MNKKMLFLIMLWSISYLAASEPKDRSGTITPQAQISSFAKQPATPPTVTRHGNIKEGKRLIPDSDDEEDSQREAAKLHKQKKDENRLRLEIEKEERNAFGQMLTNKRSDHSTILKEQKKLERLIQSHIKFLNGDLHSQRINSEYELKKAQRNFDNMKKKEQEEKEFIAELVKEWHKRFANPDNPDAAVPLC